jgi:hypothetical protein
MTLISAILYTITDISLIIIIMSYALALKMNRSITILSLLLFFTAVFFLSMVATLDLWSMCLFGEVFGTPYPWARGLFLASASIFLLYTTWRKNK